MAAIRLMHRHRRWDQTLYFYNGEAKVTNGVVTIPHDRPEWASRAFQMGYRLDPETKREMPLDRIISRNVSAESEEKNEGPHGGRQPADRNRIRTSAEPRATRIPQRGMGSSDGDGTAVRTEGDD